MADIELVIKIPDKLYETIISDEYGVHQGRIYDIIRSGTPLPKGHGRLIDADAIITKATKEMKYPLNHEYMECVIAHMNLAPTIIEADKEYEAEVITRGNCMMCGKELTEGLFFCKECEAKAERKEV